MQEEVRAMQPLDRKIERMNADDELCGEWEIPEEIDYWGLNEFGDLLSNDETMVSEQL